jgi:hypothetical protein
MRTPSPREWWEVITIGKEVITLTNSLPKVGTAVALPFRAAAVQLRRELRKIGSASKEGG